MPAATPARQCQDDARRELDGIKRKMAGVLKAIEDVMYSPNGLKAELHGDLASILSMSESGVREQKLSGADALESRLSLVAGAGFEPATFRL
jgi:site-specific DNA recombinase